VVNGLERWRGLENAEGLVAVMEITKDRIEMKAV